MQNETTTCTWWRNIYFLDNFRFLHMSSTITSSKSLLCQRQMWFEYVVFGVSYHIASSIGSNVSIECFINDTWSLTINMITKLWIYFLFAVLNLKHPPYPVTGRRVFGWSNQKSLEMWLFISREMPLIFAHFWLRTWRDFIPHSPRSISVSSSYPQGFSANSLFFIVLQIHFSGKQIKCMFLSQKGPLWPVEAYIHQWTRQDRIR